MVQRVFPVEAARVLAARENASSGQLTEIVWKVQSSTNGPFIWELGWRDAAGNTTRTARVSYPMQTLKEGPDFYRQVFQQLWTNGWRAPSRLSSAKAMEKFWLGAEDADPAREESLGKALQLVSQTESLKNDETTAQLAGLLAHTPLPAYGARVSIDSVISARAAAWVALMEQSCAEKLPLAWSPVLFLAGRETAARKIWQEHASSNRFAATSVPGLWTLWLGKPTRKDLFLRATEQVNWGMMMAMLVYETEITDSASFLAEMIEPLRGSTEKLVELHNYGPYFAVRSSVGGGHILNGLFPFLQRHAFTDLLLKLPADDKIFAAHKEKIRSVADALPKNLKDTGDLDPSLHGFKQFAPLAKLGRTQGVGPLVPVAAVSTRDLLNYGWEATGFQMGARHRFVNRRWGVPELAKPIYRNVTMEVEGLQPFYNTQEEAKTYNYPATLARLQLVEGLFDLVGWSPSPFIPKAGEKEGAQQLARRCWLRTRDFEWHARSLWDGDNLPEVTRYMEELRDEGGPLAAGEVIGYLFQIDKDRTNIAKADPILQQMAEKLPETCQAHRNATYVTKYGTNNPFITAQIYENLYWQDIESGLEETIFNHYMMADAYKSARRFFMQTRPYILDPILVSNRRGGIAFILGYLSNDEELRVAALKAGRSGSDWDLTLQIWDAAIREDAVTMKRTASEMVERYETKSGPNSRGRRLIEFIPLLPALKDPKHPQRAEALEYFADGVQWVVLRWIWTTKYKMPKEDAIALLGGRETDAFRHVVVCCLDGDLAAAKEALREYSKPGKRVTEQFTIAYYLVRQLEDKWFSRPETDLKPAEVTSTREAVFAKLKARQP